MTNKRRGERENCGEREESTRKRAHTRERREQRIPRVVQTLLIIRPAVSGLIAYNLFAALLRCRLHKRTSARTIIRGSLLRRDYSARTITVPMRQITYVSFLSDCCSSASDAHNGAQYGARFRFRNFRATHNTLRKKVDLNEIIHKRASRFAFYISAREVFQR